MTDRAYLDPAVQPSPTCPCCLNLGSCCNPDSDGLEVVDVASLCEPCLAALAGLQHIHALARMFGPRLPQLAWLHPHAVPSLHWHERPAFGAPLVGLCDGDGAVSQPAVVDDHRNQALLEQGRQASHDALVAGLGGRRASGVWWTHHTDADALTRVNDLTPPNCTDAYVLEVRAGMLEALAAPHAVLIVAWAVGCNPDEISS